MEESLTLRWAKKYRALGWSVIPLRPMGKEPLLSWTEFSSRLATDEELTKWFSEGKNNIGIVTGKLSNLAIVDLDGPEGLATGQSLSSGAVVLTGKGKQLYYRNAPVLANAVRIKPGLDIRAEGGYVCAPPSLHPNGKRYVWQSGPVNTLPPFPSSLSPAAHVSNAPIGPAKPEGWLGEALQRLGAGNRNDTFTSIVGRFHRDGIDPSSITSILRPHADRVGFAISELEAVVSSITRKSRPEQQSENSEAIDAFLADITPVGWICSPFFARKSIGFLAGLPETCKTWLLIDLAIECARGGGKWLGQFHCSPAKVLFIDQERFKGETQRRFKSVLKAKGLQAKDLRETLSVKTGSSIRINLEQSYSAFRRELSDLRPDICMVDSFATFHTSEENDRMAIQLVMDRLKTLRNEFGTTFVFIDHENKSVYSDKENGGEATAFRMVGSVGKVAAAEFCLTVRKISSGSSIIHHTKSTLAPASKSFFAQVVDTPDGGVKVEGKYE